ncbi:MAG: efflux RND transporter permease subunit, partial [Dehalococcoidia bacterium]
MSILTNLALGSRPITIFMMLLVLGAGVFAYMGLRQDLYPEYDYPFVTVVTFYPSANPQTVERDVTDPIEDAILGASGIKQIQSTSAANQSLIMVEFEFDEDMAEAERLIQSRVNGVTLPDRVADPVVRRIGSEMVPVLQLSLVSDRDLPALERVIDDVLL